MNYDELIPTWTPAELRLHEALYFLRMFERGCGSRETMDSWLEWIANADAFVMALISVENLVSQKRKRALNDLDSFGFLKATRNATVHELPWFASKQSRRATAPTRRAISLVVGSEPGRFVEPMNSIDAVLTTLKRRRRKWKWEKNTIKAARRYLRAMKRKTDNDNFFVIDVFKETFDAAAKVCRAKITDLFASSPASS